MEKARVSPAWRPLQKRFIAYRKWHDLRIMPFPVLLFPRRGKPDASLSALPYEPPVQHRTLSFASQLREFGILLSCQPAIFPCKFIVSAIVRQAERMHDKLESIPVFGQQQIILYGSTRRFMQDLSKCFSAVFSADSYLDPAVVVFAIVLEIFQILRYAFPWDFSRGKSPFHPQ